jgi:prepilin-type N-terminal cleavage/methylation domain-containing protein
MIQTLSSRIVRFIHKTMTVFLLLAALYFSGAGWASETTASSAAPVADLWQALADTTRERNALKERVDSVTAQQRLISLYGIVMTVLAFGLGFALLRRQPQPHKKPGSETDLHELFGSQKSTAIQKRNVTVTVHNDSTHNNTATQKNQKSGRIETRQVFGQDNGPGSESSMMRAATVRMTHTAATTKTGEQKHGTNSHPHAAETPFTHADAAQPMAAQPMAVTRVEQKKSDRLTKIKVHLKPDLDNPMRHGFSLLEVMIAMAVLATVLASVIASIYTLHTVQVQEKENARVQELGRLMVERIMGASWATLGGVDINDPNQGAWSWHRREPYDGQPAEPVLQPLREGANVPADQNLLTLNLLSGPSQLQDLRVYLDYYQGKVLDAVLTVQAGQNPVQVWKTERENHDNRIMAEDPIAFTDALQNESTLVCRIVIKWTAYRGGERQHQVLFARSQ